MHWANHASRIALKIVESIPGKEQAIQVFSRNGFLILSQVEHSIPLEWPA
jgi:hypothetical protein